MGKDMFAGFENEPMERRVARALDCNSPPELLRKLSEDKFW